MKGKKIGDLLIAAGLSEKEAVVMSELIAGGEMRMRQLAMNVGLKRVTVYALIKLLMEKGLVGTIKKGKIQFAFAKHPDNITGLFTPKKKFGDVVK